jgi:hypothetical protein
MAGGAAQQKRQDVMLEAKMQQAEKDREAGRWENMNNANEQPKR